MFGCLEPAEAPGSLQSLTITPGKLLSVCQTPLFLPLPSFVYIDAYTLLPHKVGVKVKLLFSWHPRASFVLCVKPCVHMDWATSRTFIQDGKWQSLQILLFHEAQHLISDSNSVVIQFYVLFSLIH